MSFLLYICCLHRIVRMQNKSLKSPYTFTIKSKVKVSFLIFQKYTEMRSIVTTRHWVGAGRGVLPGDDEVQCPHDIRRNLLCIHYSKNFET